VARPSPVSPVYVSPVYVSPVYVSPVRVSPAALANPVARPAGKGGILGSHLDRI